MTNDKRIKILEDTLKVLKNEYKTGEKYHNWDAKKCSACLDNRRKKKGCYRCILAEYYSSSQFSPGCIGFFVDEWSYSGDFSLVPLEDIASIVYQAILYYKEVRDDG